MVGKLLLECEGLEQGIISVPAFKVSLGEVVAVLHPIEEGQQRVSLIKRLSGQERPTKARSHCKVSFLDPFFAFTDDAMDKPLVDLLLHKGLTQLQARDVILATGLRPEMPCSDAQLTNRLLLEMKAAVLHGVELVVFSAGGLDPLGVHRVLLEANGTKTTCSSLVFFHESVRCYHEQTDLFDRLCDQVLHIGKH